MKGPATPYPRETDSNFGFNLSWWDRIFGTYTGQPKDGHLGMTIGLKQFRNTDEVTLPRLLIMPFRELEENNIRISCRTFVRLQGVMAGA